MQQLEDDGGELAACANAACLALVDAGVAMRYEIQQRRDSCNNSAFYSHICDSKLNCILSYLYGPCLLPLELQPKDSFDSLKVT